jgi:hypothetical protein
MRFVADPRCPRHYEYLALPVFRHTRLANIPVWECSVCRRPLGAATARPFLERGLATPVRRVTLHDQDLARPRWIPPRYDVA